MTPDILDRLRAWERFFSDDFVGEVELGSAKDLVRDAIAEIERLSEAMRTTKGKP